MAESPDLIDDTGRPAPDATEERERERARDARMVRGVRWRLVLFSGGATLVVLLLLGVAIYTAVENSLANTSVARMSDRVQDFARYFARPDNRPPRYDMFIGRDSGTFAYVVDPSDESVIAGPPYLDTVTGVPDAEGVRAAARNGRDAGIPLVPGTGAHR